MALEKKHIFVIDGNIGCGKTTVLNELNKNKKFSVYFEPIGLWSNFYNKNFLKEAYENKTIFAKEKFQSLIMASYLNMYFNHIFNDKSSVIFLERCHLSTIHFIKVNEKLYNFDSDFGEILRWIVQILNVYLKKFFSFNFIYLNTDLNELVKRISLRGNPDESCIEKKYLEELDILYRREMDQFDNIVTFKKTSQEICVEIEAIVNNVLSSE
jgi:deoxyadenosine/deoxycytidine kinase